MSRSSSSSTSSGTRRRIRHEIRGLGLLDSVWAGHFPKNSTSSPSSTVCEIESLEPPNLARSWNVRVGLQSGPT